MGQARTIVAVSRRRYSEGYGVGVVIERTCARPGRDQGVT